MAAKRTTFGTWYVLIRCVENATDRYSLGVLHSRIRNHSNMLLQNHQVKKFLPNHHSIGLSKVLFCPLDQLKARNELLRVSSAFCLFALAFLIWFQTEMPEQGSRGETGMPTRLSHSPIIHPSSPVPRWRSWMTFMGALHVLSPCVRLSGCPVTLFPLLWLLLLRPCSIPVLCSIDQSPSLHFVICSF